MKVLDSTMAMTFDDVPGATAFLTDHFDFDVDLSGEGFAVLTRPDMGVSLLFLQRGLAPVPAPLLWDHAAGSILALTVDDLETEVNRLKAEGVTVTLELMTTEWGERGFQVEGPENLLIHLLDWPDGAPT